MVGTWEVIGVHALEQQKSIRMSPVRLIYNFDFTDGQMCDKEGVVIFCLEGFFDVMFAYMPVSMIVHGQKIRLSLRILGWKKMNSFKRHTPMHLMHAHA